MAQPQTSARIRTQPKKKKNQIPLALGVLILSIGFAIFLGGLNMSLAAKWIFGLAFGFVLQRARFCFTASLRDPVLTGSTSLTRGVLIAFMVATVGFAGIQFSAHMAGKPIPGFVSPVGIHTAIGATLFGIGMVIAGGCASGTLMRMGEGFLMQWVAIVFFVIGSVLGAYHFGWWKAVVIKNAPAVHLPTALGWSVGVFGQLALLGALYVLATWYEYRNAA